jgi:phage terminase small subunit
MGLTAKQKRLCEEYIIDLNGTQAAIRAGYSSRTANEQAARLLAKASAQEYIQKLKQDRSARTEITADRVLQELAAVAFAKIDDFIRVEQVTATVDLGEDQEGNPITDTRTYKAVEIFETDKVDQAKMPAIASIKQGRDGIELKTHDKIKSLELLGRHLGMWNDKMDVTSKGESLNEKKPVIKLPDGTMLEI